MGKSNRKKRKSIIKPAAEQTNQIFFWLPWLQTACQASQYEIENLHPAEEKDVAYWLQYFQTTFFVHTRPEEREAGEEAKGATDQPDQLIAKRFVYNEIIRQSRASLRLAI